MADELKVKANRFKSELKPIWCPGCGDFGVLAAAYRAFAELDLEPDRTVIVSGIGCSSRFPGFVTTYGFHGVHGRALPDRDGREAGEPRPDRDRGRRRWRRLRDRRRPLPARRAAQRRHHLRDHGQPDLRPHEGPGLAHLAARAALAVDAVRQPRGADERGGNRGRRGLRVRRARGQLPLQGADRADRRGHPAARASASSTRSAPAPPSTTRRSRGRKRCTAARRARPATTARRRSPRRSTTRCRSESSTGTTAPASTACCRAMQEAAEPVTLEELVDGFAVAPREPTGGA